MAICVACQKSALLTDKIGKLVLCKTCSKKIQGNKWKEKEYATNEEIRTQRNVVLNLASQNGFPDNVIEEIRQYFNSKIEDGLIRIVDGGRGQILKVYENKCVIITKSSFSPDDLAAEYAKVKRKIQPANNKTGAAEAVVKGLLTEVEL